MRADAASAIGGHTVAMPAPLSWVPPGIDEPLARAVELLRAAQHVAVVSHRNPDGDAIGSTLGAALVVEALGKRVTRINVDVVPHELTFLEGAGELVHAAPPGVDVTILLDCSSPDRTGLEHDPHLWAGRVICLDHHRTAADDGIDAFVHDEQAAATAELVYRLVVACGVPLTPAMAACLFTSLHTDTGSFRYGCTTAGAMEVGQALLRTGIDAWEVASRLYEQQRAERVALLGLALGSLRVSAGGRLATIVVDDAMVAQVGAEASDADGFINYARSIRGVEVAAQLTSDGPGAWRVSFRSRGTLDVAALAARLGGGGHRNAAGCRMVGDVEAVRAAMSEALVALLEDC